MKSLFKKLIRMILLLPQKIRIGYYRLLSDSVMIHGKPILSQPLLVVGKGTLVFHEQVRVGYFPSPGYFNTYAHFDLRGSNACIEIGEGTVINNNSSLTAEKAKISIGKKCLIGENFTVCTSDSHPLDPQQRHTSKAIGKNVWIDDNVFIGSHVTILKGVSIGKNSVVGNGSIVIRDIPENVVAAGIPCGVIRQL